MKICFISLNFISIQKDNLKAHGPSVWAVNFLPHPFIFETKPTDEIWKFALLAYSKKFHPFFGGLNWKPEVSFPPNFSWSFSVTSLNSYHSFWLNQCTFSTKKPIKFEILNLLAHFNKIGRSFRGRNWKPSVSFSSNFRWPFSVTRWNSYHSFWLNQCTF